jgi:hypothetical protein
MCLAQKAKKLEASHGKLGDLVSRSVTSWLPDGTAELLDDVISEVLEYIQGRNHLVIVEGFRYSWAEKKDLLEHVNGGLTDPSLEGSSFLLRVIFIVIFVFILDGRFVSVNTPVTPSLLTLFEGSLLNTRHQPFLQGLRARSKGISSPSPRRHWWFSNCRGSSPVRLDNVSCQSVVRWLSWVKGLLSVPAVTWRSSQRGSGKLN